MADQPIEPIKRNRYYYKDEITCGWEPKHLQQDLFDEFHLLSSRTKLASLYEDNWGVVQGLEVSATVGASTLTVNPGVALDGRGQLISLASEGRGYIQQVPPNPEEENPDVSVPVTIDLSDYIQPTETTYYLTIEFAENLRPNDDNGTTCGKWEQTPWIRLQPVEGESAYVEDGSSVVLAIVTIKASGEVDIRSQDDAFPYHRRLVGKTVGQLQIRRTEKVGDTIEEVTAGKLGPVDGGGLQLTVPDGNLKVEGTVEATAFEGEGVVPVGAVLPFAGVTPPSGWLLCDGAQVSREKFQRLFSVIDTTYGEGDGSTTFNLPDLRGQVAIGAGTFPGLTTRNLGETIGAESHTLNPSEIPQHTHSGSTLDTGVHTHSGSTDKYNLFDMKSGSSGRGFVLQLPRSGTRFQPSSHVHRHNVYTTENGGEHAHNFVTDGGNGEGEPHNNIQPSLVLNHIIKT